MKTGEFFRRSLHVYLYVAAIFLAGASLLRYSVEQVSSAQQFALRPLIVIDAGHGGIDSGASCADGTPESELNLQIAKRLDALLRLMGWQTKMTRQTADSIETEGETIRQRKQSDLNNRVEIVNSQQNAILISIHQNFYPDSRYSGPQILYAGNSDQTLAAAFQSALTEHLAPGSQRQIKRAEGIYLMRKIQCPGILVECGFLSNPAEASNLQSAAYQKRLCSIIAATLVQNTGGRISA